MKLSSFRLLAVLSTVAIVYINVQSVLRWNEARATKSVSTDASCGDPVAVLIKNPVEVVTVADAYLLPDEKTVIEKNYVSVIGRPGNKGFLTIGVPSIRRVNGRDYLLRTIDSLVERVAPSEKSSVSVVVFLADLDADYNDESARAILSRYSTYVNSSFLQIIRVSPNYYPSLVDLKRNFGDAPDRVRWRAKQVADFALMFTYARNMSDFYIQIEDDVMCAHGFVAAIRSYINERNEAEKRGSNWAMLEFSELGFIGKLFRSSDLDRLAHYMLMFYAEQPVDWLMTYFRLSMGQRTVYLRKPTLFQHFGVKSSFDISRNNNLKDRFFNDASGEWADAVYPSAVVLTTMPYYEKNIAELAYNSGNGFFWATKVQKNDMIQLIFEQQQPDLERVVVVTGNEANPNDTLHSGSLWLSPSVSTIDEKRGKANCENLVKVASFVKGRAVAENIRLNFRFAVRCIQITVDGDQNNWALFNRIAVFKSSKRAA